MTRGWGVALLLSLCFSCLFPCFSFPFVLYWWCLFWGGLACSPSSSFSFLFFCGVLPCLVLPFVLCRGVLWLVLPCPPVLFGGVSGLPVGLGLVLLSLPCFLLGLWRWSSLGGLPSPPVLASVPCGVFPFPVGWSGGRFRFLLFGPPLLLAFVPCLLLPLPLFLLVRSPCPLLVVLGWSPLAVLVLCLVPPWFPPFVLPWPLAGLLFLLVVVLGSTLWSSLGGCLPLLLFVVLPPSLPLGLVLVLCLLLGRLGLLWGLVAVFLGWPVGLCRFRWSGGCLLGLWRWPPLLLLGRLSSSVLLLLVVLLFWLGRLLLVGFLLLLFRSGFLLLPCLLCLPLVVLGFLLVVLVFGLGRFGGFLRLVLCFSFSGLLPHH